MPASDRRSGCPISISLEIFGDRWSLLIIRDLMFENRRSFREFCAAGENIATNVLTDRLERLERTGIIEWRLDPADGRRAIYSLTDKGFDLAPMLIEMVIWAAKYENTDAPPAVVKAMKRDRAGFIGGLRARTES
jgi:DNA-binding HxlR family transcriptional regulator